LRPHSRQLLARHGQRLPAGCELFVRNHLLITQPARASKPLFVIAQARFSLADLRGAAWQLLGPRLLFELFQLRFGRGEHCRADGDLGPQLPLVDSQERLAPAHMITDFDTDLLDDASDVRADRDVLGPGLDDSRGRDALGKGSARGGGGRCQCRLSL
jgi:hypothetical protein